MWIWEAPELFTLQTADPSSGVSGQAGPGLARAGAGGADQTPLSPGSKRPPALSAARVAAGTLLQATHNLRDPGMEETLLDSHAARQFTGEQQD